MSLVTQMIVAEKYGPRLTLDQLSELLRISKGTIHNQLSAATARAALADIAVSADMNLRMARKKAKRIYHETQEPTP